MIACWKQFHAYQYHEIDSAITKSYVRLELIFTCTYRSETKTENHILVTSMSTHGYELFQTYLVVQYLNIYLQNSLIWIEHFYVINCGSLVQYCMVSLIHIRWAYKTIKLFSCIHVNATQLFFPDEYLKQTYPAKTLNACMSI